MSRSFLTTATGPNAESLHLIGNTDRADGVARVSGTFATAPIADVDVVQFSCLLPGAKVIANLDLYQIGTSFFNLVASGT